MRAMLGIETSCDETSVAILEADGRVRSNLIASQIERHRPFGGVVPEIASREHLAHLMPLLEESLEEASIPLDEIGAISVTSGPGLIGALLVGVAAAQGLGYGLGIPVFGINHLEGHLYSPFLRLEGPAEPLPDRFLALVVSGGHSSIYHVRGEDPGSVLMLNRTRDDAAGEIFDKVGKFVGLPYPGGPQIEKKARLGDPRRFDFPIARFKEESLDFSFSGLKSTAIRTAREHELDHAVDPGDAQREALLADFCASFQRAVVDQILDRLDRLWRSLSEGPTRDGLPTEIAVAGGVAANSSLRERLEEWGSARSLGVRLSERRFCTDNAAMIAFAGLRRREGEVGDPLRIQARSRAQIGAF